jgi:hypothetical protein
LGQPTPTVGWVNAKQHNIPTVADTNTFADSCRQLPALQPTVLPTISQHKHKNKMLKTNRDSYFTKLASQ